MANVSKNSRSGNKAQQFFCPCGGEIQMHTTMLKGRMQHKAVCGKCNDSKRRPKDFAV